MVLSLAPVSLADIARDAAAGAVINEYLELRGIKTPATLALLRPGRRQFGTDFDPTPSPWMGT